MNPLAGSRVFAFAAAAVCVAPLCAQRPLHERVNEALEKALPALTKHLENCTKHLDAGHLGLMTLAAVHDGMDPTSAPLKDALERLAEAPTDQTYALSLRLMVAEACARFPDREAQSKRDLKALLRNRADGGFGYSPGQGGWDLSNTQYGALGLRAAASLGHDVPKSVWSSLAAAVGRTQRGKGFAYTTSGGEATLSMTAAGIAVLAVCEQQLEKVGASLSDATAKRRERGWEWVKQNKGGIGSVTTPHCHYFHYGLLRAAVLDDVTDIDGVDWYERGANMLIEHQHAGGGWGGVYPRTGVQDGDRIGQPIDTAFAVLFLRRKFQKQAGPVTGARTVTLQMLDAKSSDDDVKNCGDYLGKRGKSAMMEILTALRADVVPKRRAALAGLAAIAGQDFGIDASKDASANSEALRKAELWYLKNR